MKKIPNLDLGPSGRDLRQQPSPEVERNHLLGRAPPPTWLSAATCLVEVEVIGLDDIVEVEVIGLKVSPLGCIIRLEDERCLVGEDERATHLA
jgi:hypothetical protein